MGKTFAEKVLAAKAGLDTAVAGQIVVIKPDRLLSHDNTAAIIGKIKAELAEYGVRRPEMHCIVLDHVIPAASEKTATNHLKIREYVAAYGLPNFYDVGVGVCHQVMVEKGLARPGNVIVGSDSHTCSYGALGVFATGIDRTEAAALILRGETWLKVPDSIKVTLTGKLQPGVTAKDLVLHIIGDIGADGASYQAVEFHGAVDTLTMEQRLTVANMGIEMGAKVAVFPVDAIAQAYLEQVGVRDYQAFWADDDATYVRELHYDLSALEPVVACPHTVDNVKPVSDLLGLEFHQFLLGTCTNGRISDLEEAADILDGHTVAASSRLLVLPASKEIYEQALDSGLIARLSRAGGIVLPPGCGPCLGAHQGALAPGERCLSTANRNFKGRMGCKEADIYLSSPATLAASAIAGRLADPRDLA